MEAIVRGTNDGVGILVAVIATLIVLVALASSRTRFGPIAA